MEDNRTLESGVEPSELFVRVQQLEQQVKEKDDVINNLEQLLEEQKLLRIEDSHAVEEKAAKIKDWVTNKIKELEMQNQALTEQNDRYREELDRCRMQLKIPLSPKNGPKLIQRKSTEDSSRGSYEDQLNPEEVITDLSKTPKISPDVPGHDYDEVCDEMFDEEDDYDSVPDESDTGSPSTDDNVKPVPVAPPRVKIERKPFPDHHESYLSTSNSEDQVDKAVTAQNIEQRSKSLPPKTELSSIPPEPPAHGASHVAQTVKPPLAAKPNGPLVNGIAIRRVGVTCAPPQQPPSPPLHRIPSWERRIYEMAEKGMTLATEDGDNKSENIGDSSLPVTEELYTAKVYEHLSIPVYAALHGRASLIRSRPFSGDSPESSDNEEFVSLQSSPTPTKSYIQRDESLESNLSDDYSVPPDAMVADPNDLGVVRPSKMREEFKNKLLDKVKGMSSAQSTSSIQSKGSMQSKLSAVSKDSNASTKTYMLEKDKHNKTVIKEKAGYLSKLGGRVKTWKKQWFVIKNGELVYYKTQNDRRPAGRIMLDSQCTVTKASNATTFQVESKSKKRTYYLAGDTEQVAEEWVKAIQDVLKRTTSRVIFEQTNNKAVLKGWLTKVKHGHTRKCWCVLSGKNFIYYRNQNDRVPIGTINMKAARVEEIDNLESEDELDADHEHDDKGSNEQKKGVSTIAIHVEDQGTTYLLISSKEDKDTWLYHLTMTSGGGIGASGTQFEQLISKLMEVDGDPGCPFWKHPLLLHSRESITEPLTTLPMEHQQFEAVRLFKSCQLFMSVLVDRAGIDYHVVLAQNALQLCLAHPELQHEMYCQLMKQTTKHPAPPKTGMQHLFLCASHSWFLCDQTQSPNGTTAPGTNSGANTTDKLNPANFVFLQGWMLLAMCISLFLPKQNRILWYLKMHLQRHSDARTEIGKYAAFCQRVLERTERNGGREAKPSRMEALSIIMRNPYHHCLPISIPVHFLNGTYQVVSFDGSSTVEEFLYTLNQELGMRDIGQSGFALYTDDPAGKDIEHCLQSGVKICDVISTWEQTLKEKQCGKIENSKVVKLTYKNRLYFKSQAASESEKEKLFLCYQATHEVACGRFPMTRAVAIEMTALMIQIDHGDYRPDSVHSSGGAPLAPPQIVERCIEKFHPKQYRENQTPEQEGALNLVVLEKWEDLKGKSQMDCVRCYLNAARQWPYFGAKLYQAKTKTDEPSAVWLAVQEQSIEQLDYTTMEFQRSFTYKEMITFGGFKDDFMIVVNNAEGKPEKFLFHMKPVKVLDITQLMASFINSHPSIHLFVGSRSPSVLRAGDKNVLHKAAHAPLGKTVSTPAGSGSSSSNKLLSAPQDRKSDAI